MTSETPTQPQKRRRVDRVIAACDLCKRRKVKCDGVRKSLLMIVIVIAKCCASWLCIRRIVKKRTDGCRNYLARIARGRISQLHAHLRLLKNAVFSPLVTLRETLSHIALVLHVVSTLR